MDKKLLLILVGLLTYFAGNANVNILKNTPVSCSGSSSLSYINDGNYATSAQLSAGTRYVYFNLPHDIYTKKTHCYIYLEDDIASSANVVVYGRNNGGSWNILGNASGLNGKLIDVTCTGNYHIDQIRIRIYSPYSIAIREAVYAAELESIATLYTTPSDMENSNRLRDGLETPYLEFAGRVKKTITYYLDGEYDNLRIMLKYRGKDYSSRHLKISLLQNGTYKTVADFDIHHETYLTGFQGSEYANRIKIELEGSRNQGDRVSLEEIRIFGNRKFDINDGNLDYPNVSFAMNNPSNYRPMAEWEDAEGILVYWPSSCEGYITTYSAHANYLIKLIKELDKVGKVFLLCNDINDFIDNIGSDINTLNNLEIIYADDGISTWARDRGPIPVFKLSDASPAGVSFNCYSASTITLASYIGYPLIYGCQADRGTLGVSHLDGGNFSADQDGAAIVNYSPYCLPPEQMPGDIAMLRSLLEDYFGADKQMVAVKGLHNTHIDYFMKPVSNNKILTYSNDYDVAEEAVDNFYNEYGKNFNIGLIPSYFGYEINSLIFNGNVFVPVPNDQVKAYNIKAAYQGHMPGYNIVTIATGPDAFPNGAGNVHCLTMTIPPADPILMSKMSLSGDYESPEFSMEIRTKSGVESANIFHKQEGERVFQSNRLEKSEHDHIYKTRLHDIDIERTEFYVEVKNKNGKVLASPYPGAAGPMALKSVSSSIQTNLPFTVELYPNPAKDQVMVKSSSLQDLKLAIYTLDGTLVTEKTILSGTQIDVSDYLPGLYIVKTYNPLDENDMVFRKLSIE